jgi:hypothetical protein
MGRHGDLDRQAQHPPLSESGFEVQNLLVSQLLQQPQRVRAAATLRTIHDDWRL